MKWKHALLRTVGIIPFALAVSLPAFAQDAAQQSATTVMNLQQVAGSDTSLAQQIRAELMGSGLSADQIRARLVASGYSEHALDAYLGGQTQGAQNATLVPDSLDFAAMQALGLPVPSELHDSLRVDTGLVRMRDALRAESLATGNYVFGVDVFRRTTTQFLPALGGPVPPDYKLGAGDRLVLILTGDVEVAHALQVTREGFVLIPQVGEVFVTNLTLDQLRDVLYSRLHRVYSGVRPGPDATTRFDISVASVRVNQVYVLGEVKQPGAYQISALGTVLTSLYAAGGVTNRAGLRQVEVHRLNQPPITIDVYDYLLHGDKRSDVRLETGDVVFVPLHGTRAQLTGAVLRPAIYELKPGQTLVDLVRSAGGFRPNAALRRLSIHRIVPAAQRGPGLFPRTVVDLPLPIPVPGDDPSPPSTAVEFSGVLVPGTPLEDGDSVVVDSLPPLTGTLFVAIAGMVNKPGRYPWREGMTLRDLVLLARGPKVGAYLKEAEIASLPADRSGGQLAQTIRVPLDSTYLLERDSAGRYFGPPGLTFAASGAHDVTLKPYDNVLILRQPDFELQRTVFLTGEVRFPGTYSLISKNERISDLINRAGGLTPQAYPDGIRFVRAVGQVGRIDVDLARALKDPSSAQDIALQPEDSIDIPEYEPSVKVSGAVNSPGSVLWHKGNSLDFYLGAAGGPSYRADKGRVSVKYANGEVRTRHRTFVFSSDPTPGPGSEVFVPVKDTTPNAAWITAVGAFSGIVSGMLALVILIKNL